MSPLTAAQLLALAETDVLQRLSPEQLNPVLSSHPFIDVEGTFNLRDLGRIPRDAGVPPSKVRTGFAYRSGALHHLTDKGKATLATELRVRRIFDLRSQSEHASTPDPLPAEGVTLVWEQTAEETPHVSIEPFAEGFGEKGYAAMYLNVLKAYAPTIRSVLEHVRDRPAEPFLFHCTAGRDRTGVMAGLLLSLAGEPAEAIALDYILTRIGAEPARDQLESFARSGAGVLTGMPGTTDDGSGEKAAPPAMPAGFLNLLNLRVICWNAFLEAAQKEYGPACSGFEGYVKSIGFSDAEVATIRANLTTGPV